MPPPRHARPRQTSPQELFLSGSELIVFAASAANRSHCSAIKMYDWRAVPFDIAASRRASPAKARNRAARCSGVRFLLLLAHRSPGHPLASRPARRPRPVRGSGCDRPSRAILLAPKLRTHEVFAILIVTTQCPDLSGSAHHRWNVHHKPALTRLGSVRLIGGSFAGTRAVGTTT